MSKSVGEDRAAESSTEPMTEPMLVDKDEAARLLGVSPRTIEAWAAARKIPSVKLGQGKRSPLRFRPADLRAWIAARVVAVEGEKQ